MAAGVRASMRGGGPDKVVYHINDSANATALLRNVGNHLDVDPTARIVVVSHADPIKSAIAHYTGIHLDLFQRLHVSPASVTVLDFHAYGALLVKCNDTGGLADLVPEPQTEPAPEPDPAP